MLVQQRALHMQEEEWNTKDSGAFANISPNMLLYKQLFNILFHMKN